VHGTLRALRGRVPLAPKAPTCSTRGQPSRLAVVVALALSLALPRAARAAPTRVVSLDEALSLARARHPLTRVARSRVDAARVAVDVPRSAWLPRVGAFAELVGSTVNNSTTTLLSRPEVDLPRIGATKLVTPETVDMSMHPSTVVALGARQLVFDAGRVGAETRVAEAVVAVEEARSATASVDVELAATEAFLAVRGAHEIVRSRAEAWKRAEARLAFVTAAIAAGLRPAIDEGRAVAERARAEAERTRAEGQLRLARSNLALVTGVSDPELDAAPLPSATEPPPLPSAEVVAKDALRDPRLRELGAVRLALAASAEATWAELRPSLLVTSSLSMRGGGAPNASGPAPWGDGWAPNIPNASVALVLSAPIFDGSVAARARAARAREAAAAIELEALRDRVLAEARAVRTRADVEQRSLPSLEAALRAAEAAEREADARFRAGLGTLVELVDAESLRVSAEVALAAARFDARRARAVLERVRAGGTRP
jgi:outer membrane protein